MSSSAKEPSIVSRTGAPSEKPELLRVRNILQSFAHTVSVLKLYPARHDHVGRYRDELHGRLDEFLREIGPLELGIGEDVFTYLGQVVYKDDNIQKSLPYFFFKDGMQKLSFLPGLTTADLQDFLSLIRDAFQQVSGSADIVDLMWQKEIEHLRFFAPNEFLTSKVAEGTTMPLDFSVDPRVLTEGTIELAPEDKAGPLSAAAEAAVREVGSAYGDPAADTAAALEDAAALTVLLESERRIPIERDFFDTIYELLRIDDRPVSFAETLEYLAQYHERLIQTSRFSSALLLWDVMAELGLDLQASQPEKTAALGALEELFRRQASPAAIRAAVGQGNIWDLPPFFAFLERIGPSVLTLVGELYESSWEDPFRAQAEAFFTRMGRHDPAALARLADPEKPALARAIIAALAGQSDRRVLPHLIVFSTHPDASVRRAVAQAVRAFPGREARRALAGFLDDPDETLRIEAALALRSDADPDSAPALLRIAGSSDFRNRDPEEITAFLDALGATKTREALDLLSGWVAKRRWRMGEKTLALALAAVRGLERMGTPSAEAVLGAGARRRNRRLREACRAARARLSGRFGPARGAA
jgi:hypothetical protein